MRWTLASGITLARLLFLPAIIWLLLTGQRWIAFGVLLIVLGGDLVDGALARLRAEVTELGKLLDPLVDKIVFLALFAALVWMGDLPWLALALLAILQIGIVFGALVWLRRRRDAPSARLVGKIASFVLSLGLLAAFLHTELEFPYYRELVYAGILLAYLAGVDYLLSYLRAMRASPNKAGIRAGEER